jgi:hypothetical protein
MHEIFVLLPTTHISTSWTFVATGFALHKASETYSMSHAWYLMGPDVFIPNGMMWITLYKEMLEKAHVLQAE